MGEDAGGRWYAARFLPNGQRSDFATGLLSPMSITIGPDGDVWIADHDADLVRRFSPRGVAKGTVDIAGSNLFLIDLAFSPAGVLHLANFNDAVYKVVNGRLERVITSTYLGSMAFDQVGNLYVGTGDRGIMMYDANYKLVHSPFAEAGLDVTGNIVFSRDAAGAMMTRLFGVNLEEGAIREVNPAGVSAPGFRIGADLLVIAVDSVRRATMGAGYADTLRVSGVAAGVSWTITNGVLPRGITLSSGGELTGVPAESGSFPFEVRATSGGRIGVQPLILTVARPSVDAAAASNQLLGVTGALSPELEKFLDLQGNANGRYDVGDLRAWLQSRAALKPLMTRK